MIISLSSQYWWIRKKSCLPRFRHSRESRDFNGAVYFTFGLGFFVFPRVSLELCKVNYGGWVKTQIKKTLILRVFSMFDENTGLGLGLKLSPYFIWHKIAFVRSAKMPGFLSFRRKPESSFFQSSYDLSGLRFSPEWRLFMTASKFKMHRRNVKLSIPLKSLRKRESS